MRAFGAREAAPPAERHLPRVTQNDRVKSILVSEAKTGRSDPSSDRIKLLMLMALALAVLGSVFMIGTLLKSESITASAPTLAGEGVATTLFLVLGLGFRSRKSWAWWTGLCVFGLLTLAFFGLFSMTGLKVWEKGFGDRHAVGAGGEFLLLILTPIFSVLFGIPFVALLRSRKAFKE